MVQVIKGFEVSSADTPDSSPRQSSPEPLLPGCVPELQLDTDPRLHLQEVNIKVYTYCLVDRLQEHVLSVALQHGGLPHGGVPQHDDPELVLPQGQVHLVGSEKRRQADKNSTL